MCGASAWMVGAHALDKPIIDLPVGGSTLDPGRQLQDAVNNPANAGVVLRLARGTYVLDPARPAGGRLILQPGMEIVGENEYVDCDEDGVWDPVFVCIGGSASAGQFTLDDSETVIDGSAITAVEGISAAVAAQRSTSVIRLGRDNALTHVTVRAPNRFNVGGSVDINVLPDVGGLNGVVADNILDGGQRGIRCNNGPVPRSGIASTATIERNIVRNVSRAPDTPAPQPGFGFAIQVQNGFTTGSSWDVIVRNNRIYDNLIGVFIVGNQSSSSETNVLSMRNIIATNQAGMVIVSGFDGANTPGTDSDFQVISQEDRILDNVGSPFLARGGGVLAVAGANDTVTAAGSSGNRLRLQFLQTEFSGNLQGAQPRHLAVFGYLTNRNRTNGTNNQVRLLVRRADGDYQQGGFTLTDSQPAGTNQTNKVIMIGSNVAFEATNEVFDVPDEQPSLQP